LAAVASSSAGVSGESGLNEPLPALIVLGRMARHEVVADEQGSDRPLLVALLAAFLAGGRLGEEAGPLHGAHQALEEPPEGGSAAFGPGDSALEAWHERFEAGQDGSAVGARSIAAGGDLIPSPVGNRLQ
jgi:hypothetical protein